MFNQAQKQAIGTSISLRNIMHYSIPKLLVNISNNNTIIQHKTLKFSWIHDFEAPMKISSLKILQLQLHITTYVCTQLYICTDGSLSTICFILLIVTILWQIQGDQEGCSSLITTSRNTKDSMYSYKNALKHINSLIKCHFYTSENMMTHTFRSCTHHTSCFIYYALYQPL